MSRKLLTAKSAHANAPTTSEAVKLVAVSFSVITKVVPVVATTPKNTNTNTSPNPKYP